MHGLRSPPIAPDGPIRGREAMEACDHPRAMEGRRVPSMVMRSHEWPALVSLSRLVFRK